MKNLTDFPETVETGVDPRLRWKRSLFDDQIALQFIIKAFSYW